MTKRSKIVISFLMAFTETLIFSLAPNVFDVVDVVQYVKNSAPSSQASTSQTSSTRIPAANSAPSSQASTSQTSSTPIPAASLVGQPLSYAQSKLNLNQSNPVTGNVTAFPSGQNYPTSININVGSTVGFSFFNDAWGQGTYGAGVSVTVPSGSAKIAADLSSYVNNLDWSKGITFLMVAVDSNNNVIKDLTKVFPISYYLFIYDGNKNYITNVSIPVNAAALGSGFNPYTPYTNTLALGINAGTGATAAYPAAFTITGPAPKQVASAGAISLQAASSYKTYSDLKGALTSEGVTLNEATANFTALAPSKNYPNSMNINFGTIAGFSFFSDVWGNGTQVNEASGTFAADLATATNSFAQGSWTTGIRFVLLGFDVNKNIITDLTKVAPAKFTMFMYDKTSGKYLGQTVVPLNGATKNSGFTQPTSTTLWPAGSNSLALGINGSLAGSATYPAAFTITIVPAGAISSQGVSSYKTYSDLKGALTTAGVTLNEATNATTLAPNQNYPSSFNINFGTTAGFSFFSDAWNNGTQGNLTPGAFAADLATATNSFAQGSWTTGIRFVLLGFDANKDIIIDLSKVAPAQFIMFMYDQASGKSLGQTVVPLSGATLNSGFTQPTPATWPENSNGIIVGINGVSAGLATYPATFTITAKKASGDVQGGF